MQISINNPFVHFPFTIFIPLFHKCDFIAPLCSKILEGSLIMLLFDFSLTVKAATLIFISGVVRLFHLLRKGNQVLCIIW